MNRNETPTFDGVYSSQIKSYEQHKAEMPYTIGAGSVGTIMGANKYSSPYRLYLEMRDEVEKFQGNESSEIGTFFENTIIEFFLKDHPELTQIFPIVLDNVLYFYSDERKANVFIHPEIQFLTGIPDMICKDREGNVVIIEAKNNSEYTLKDWDECPRMAYYQTLTYIELLNAQYGYVIGLVGGNKFITHKVERNDKVMNEVKDQLIIFHKRLINGDPPDVTAIDKETIEEHYPKLEDVETEFPYLLNEVFDELEILKAQQKEIKTKRDELENTIRVAMGDNSAGCTDIWKATQKDTITNRFNTTQFKLDRIELYKKYLNPSTSRRLTIKKLKG